MAFRCGVICDEEAVLRLAGLADPQGACAARYARSLLESYVEDNSRARWCPAVPSCGRAILLEGDSVHVEPSCGCGASFCFGCGGSPHSPCTCDMWTRWCAKNSDASETTNWMAAHTLPCPKCGKAVEKNGGCNLVVCPCGQAFCWLCGQATGRDHTWTNIAGHSCGRYKEDTATRQQQAEKDLKRCACVRVVGWVWVWV